ncbi:NHL repeat-containing protein 2-like isoform X2 [Mizuhopecten yessoensis]|nr:NHL repeat-containing protein 2-like isoform X2 [Mizuhopecten yessoensis]XP_021371937.1 NHL repeat-containing protein 2-like isoform X2 [Mizuhopecten yessoensis]XP_021371938.1 NHL repeat-containing protein 2-like isoform X2 [Mizuhopecten yessoensis]
MDEVQAAEFELLEELMEVETAEKKQETLRKYIEKMETNITFPIPDFENDLQWLNTALPLSLTKELEGKLVVMDFFTYCCVNCLHILPDLEQLEELYKIQDGVVVLGVHSAKFDNEKVLSNILSAVLRYNINHPVVNDGEATLWNKLRIACWPTLLVVSPTGKYLRAFVGEGHKESLEEFLKLALDYYRQKGMIKTHSLPISLEKDKLPATPLKFPGKVAVSGDGKLIAIADSGHDQVLICSKDGIVQSVVGGGKKGLQDGSFKDSQFNSPQGMVFVGDDLYVADTENHVVRKVGLKSGSVTTVVGTGVQGQDKEGGNTGTQQEISSPWDLDLGRSIGSESKDILFIAMAGTHQIWVYFLQDGKWYKGRHHKARTCLRFAGSGSEENRNNSYPARAAFAQPSGLAVSTHPDVNSVFVADSESSTVRSVTLKDGAVKGFVGGEKDPMNLFAYGDADGVGIEAKLQHPLGVALVTDNKGPLLVADSYNHKIKSVDIISKKCETWAAPSSGSSEKGNNSIPIDLNEPGGLCVDQVHQLLYIADTNNHVIRTVDLATSAVSQLPILFPNPDEADGTKEKQVKDFVKPSTVVIDLPPVHIAPATKVDVRLHIPLPDGHHFTDEAPSSWLMVCKDEANTILNIEFDTNGRIESSEEQSLMSFTLPSDLDLQKYVHLYIKCRVFYCDDSNVCRLKENVYKQVIFFKDMAEAIASQSVLLNFTF